MLEYQNNKNNSLQKPYEKLRKELLKDFGFFLPTIKKIHGKDEDIGINNLERCFLVSEIENWSLKIQREIPEELDCFDSFITSIEGYYKNL